MTTDTTISRELREQQRVAHLVLGAPRPRLPKTLGKRSKKRPAPIVQLAEDIDARLAIRERWSHKVNATPETLEHASEERRREGALARLAKTQALDIHQLAAAEEIAAAYAVTVAEVSVRTARWTGRSGGGGPTSAAEERFGQVLRQQAYSRWRAAVGADGAMLLSIIIDDVGLVAAARKARMSNRRALAILRRALDGWRRV
jgi:hypothetical protein